MASLIKRPWLMTATCTWLLSCPISAHPLLARSWTSSRLSPSGNLSLRLNEPGYIPRSNCSAARFDGLPSATPKCCSRNRGDVTTEGDPVCCWL
ncbi:hypothetical protein B0H14DRAFT_2739149 [Mycena olivaceomarginata]|nr:hypothetical protein B0H14DRAFT_2739149 [Mycena olivaceomarginata]